METKSDYKYQDIKELADNFDSVQMELNNKIEDYLIDTLRKFNDDFIEFDESNKRKPNILSMAISYAYGSSD